MTSNGFTSIIKEVRKMFKIVEFSTTKEFSKAFMKALLSLTCQNLSKLPGSSEMRVVSKMKLLEANRREKNFVLITVTALFAHSNRLAMQHENLTEGKF